MSASLPACQSLAQALSSDARLACISRRVLRCHHERVLTVLGASRDRAAPCGATAARRPRAGREPRLRSGHAAPGGRPRRVLEDGRAAPRGRLRAASRPTAPH